MTIIEALVQLRNDLKLWVTNNLRVKVDKNLGTEESGKFLTVDENGDIITTEIAASATELGYMSGVTSNVQTQLNSKVDKEDGKGLSSNDFTTAEKEKLAGFDDELAVAIAEAKEDASNKDIVVLAEVQTSLDGKLSTSGGNITGNLYVSGELEAQTLYTYGSTWSEGNIGTDCDIIANGNITSSSTVSAPNLCADSYLDILGNGGEGASISCETGDNTILAFYGTSDDEKIVLSHIADPIDADDAVTKGYIEGYIVDNLVSDSTTQPLSAAQGKALKTAIDSITTDIGDLGGGDMMKATYDADGDGTVDNAARLEGYAASHFATADHTHTASDIGAVSTSGGSTISHASFGQQLNIKRSTASGVSAIQYSNNGGVLGYIGITTNGNPVMYDSTASNSYTMLHSGNIANHALPLSGGTTTDNLWVGKEGVSCVGVRSSGTAALYLYADQSGGRGLYDGLNEGAVLYYDTDNSRWVFNGYATSAPTSGSSGSAGMIEEFNTGLMSVGSYSPGLHASRFYIVELYNSSTGAYGTVVINWYGLYYVGAHTYYSGSTPLVYASMSNYVPTFTASNGWVIKQVAGYY